MLVLLVLATCTLHANAGYTQFFYSAHPPQAPFPIVHQPPPQAAYYHHQAPLAYQSFTPQYYQPITYTPFVPPIYTPHQQFYHHPYTFSNVLPPPVQTEQQPIETNTTDAPTTPPASSSASVDNDVTLPPPQQDDSVITNAVRGLSLTSQLDENSIDNYRGFGYRNDYENGRSHFIFITGPEAQKFSQRLRNNNNGPNFQSRTAASDAIDANASDEKLANDNDGSIDALIKYVDNPQIGVHQFYSVNNALVMRRLEDDMPNFGTPNTGSLPITQTTSPLFPIFKSALALNIESTTGKSDEDSDETEKEDIDADDDTHLDEEEERNDSNEKEENDGAASQVETEEIKADNEEKESSQTAKSDGINITSEVSTEAEIKISQTESTTQASSAFTSATITSTPSTTTTTTTNEASTQEVSSTSTTTEAAITTAA